MEVDWTISPVLMWCAVSCGIATMAWLAGIEIGDLIDQWRAHHPRRPW